LTCLTPNLIKKQFHFRACPLKPKFPKVPKYQQ
jgi:hypothetical protein